MTRLSISGHSSPWGADFMKRVIVAVVCGALLVAGTPATAQSTAAYDRQRIDWKPCAPTGLECATFRAPLNWTRPWEPETATIAISRKRATERAKGVTLTNPGGPGSPGRHYPAELASALPDQDLIGMDPRGTGGSTPKIGCGGLPTLPLDLDLRDRSRENVRRIYQRTEQLAKACQANRQIDVVNTEQTVRDMDLLRSLLGQQKLNFFGVSAGGWLGSHYTAYFPHRVGRFVLDSGTDFTGSLEDWLRDQQRSVERRFREDYLDWVSKSDAKATLGTNVEQVRATYEQVRAGLAANPIQVAPGRALTPTVWDLGFYWSLHKEKDFGARTQIFRAVHELQHGTGDRTPVEDWVNAFYDNPLPDTMNATFLGTICNDSPSLYPDLNREAIEQGRRYPLMGWYQLSGVCAYWQRPPLHLRPVTGNGLPPILLLGSMRDPANSHEGVLRNHQRLRGSRLITVAGSGDHGVFANGTDCVDKAVREFLSTGRPPAADLTC
ncbi:alpha/beta hydrolase [Pseudonocardiaceae bacterium YIM PH 21723]|nr:alpha/beta hydrolase [Pseudonocardiaceae bacterium YIM PH 21723]